MLLVLTSMIFQLISAADDEISFDPDDVITNIEMVRFYNIYNSLVLKDKVLLYP